MQFFYTMHIGQRTSESQDTKYAQKSGDKLNWSQRVEIANNHKSRGKGQSQAARETWLPVMKTTAMIEKVWEFICVCTVFVTMNHFWIPIVFLFTRLVCCYNLNFDPTVSMGPILWQLFMVPMVLNWIILINNNITLPCNLFYCGVNWSKICSDYGSWPKRIYSRWWLIICTGDLGATITSYIPGHARNFETSSSSTMDWIVGHMWVPQQCFKCIDKYKYTQSKSHGKQSHLCPLGSYDCKSSKCCFVVLLISTGI